MVYVANENAPNAPWGAYSTPCIVDSETGRPVAGIVVINTSGFNNWDVTENKWPFNWYSFIEEIQHEMMHALGFTSWMFRSYVDENGKVMGAEKVENSFNVTIGGPPTAIPS